MRKMLIISAIAFLPLIHGRACFGQYEMHYISLFADSTRYAHAYCSFEGDLAVVELWVHCYPGPHGQIGGGFWIVYPPNVVQGAVVANEDIVLHTCGTLDAGISTVYHECQRDTHWCIRQTLMLTSHEYAHLRLIASHFNNCDVGIFPTDVSVFWNLVLNYDQTIHQPQMYCRPVLGTMTGAKRVSWGAIKSVFER